jgi:hypothetical protein
MNEQDTQTTMLWRRIIQCFIYYIHYKGGMRIERDIIYVYNRLDKCGLAL